MAKSKRQTVGFTPPQARRIIEATRTFEAEGRSKSHDPRIPPPDYNDWWIEITGATLTSGVYYYAWKRKQRIANGSGRWQDHTDGTVSSASAPDTRAVDASGATTAIATGTITRAIVDIGANGIITYTIPAQPAASGSTSGLSGTSTGTQALTSSFVTLSPGGGGTGSIQPVVSGHYVITAAASFTGYYTLGSTGSGAQDSFTVQGDLYDVTASASIATLAPIINYVNSTNGFSGIVNTNHGFGSLPLIISVHQLTLTAGHTIVIRGKLTVSNGSGTAVGLATSLSAQIIAVAVI